MATDLHSGRRIAIGLGIISALQLGLEVLFIKLSRYQFATLSLGVIGLAIFGVALAGPLASILGGDQKAIRRSTMAAAPAALFAGAVLFALPHRWIGAEHTNLLIIACGIACLVPLALCSVPVFAAMRRQQGSVHGYYAASLAGATAGAPLGFGLLALGGDLLAFVALLSLSVPAILLLVQDRKPLIGGTVVAVLVVVVAALLLPRIDAAAHPDSDYSRTNAFSRIDVFHNRQTGGLWIATAGINAGTGLPGGTVAEPAPALLTEMPARAYSAAPRRVLILGSGAGRNVVQALAMGAEEVVAIEINGMIPDYLGEFLPLESDPYRDPRVRLIVAEGREAVARIASRLEPDKAFDLVYVPIATLFGTSGHTFTQTYLMTRQALEDYSRLLAPGGRVAVYAVEDFRSKVAFAMSEALRTHGVENPAAHMAVLEREGWFLIVGRFDEPVDPDEGALSGFDWYYRLNWLDVTEQIEQGSRLRPLTDDNPFLRNHVLAVEGEWSSYGWNLAFLSRSFRIVLALLLVAGVIGVWRADSGLHTSRSSFMAAFAAMGIGYTAYQTVVIQRLAFLVGHPLLATAIVLPYTLLGTAAGSYWSRWFDDERLARTRLVTTTALVLFIAAFATIPPTSLTLPTWPSGTRYILAMLISLLPFVVMGTFFPVIFARVKQEDPTALSFGWLLNGIGAIVGSVLAIYGPTMFGFRSMFLIAAVLYLALAGWDALSRGQGRSRAHLALVAILILTLVGILGLLEIEIAAVGRS